MGAESIKLPRLHARGEGEMVVPLIKRDIANFSKSGFGFGANYEEFHFIAVELLVFERVVLNPVVDCR